MSLPVSTAYAAFAAIERVKRDTCVIAFVFFNADGTPVNTVATQGFELAFQEDGGATILTKSGADIVYTQANRLAVTLTTADKTLLARAKYSYTLYNTVAGRTEVAGSFCWQKGRPSTQGVYSPGDLRVVYNSLTADVVIGGIVHTGQRGAAAWSPLLAVVADGNRRVQQVADWFGGEGPKPATGQYVGVTGMVMSIADGVDVRGLQGLKGDKGDPGTLAASQFPIRTIPLTTGEQVVIQRADGVLEKQAVGLLPRSARNLVTNGYGELGTTYNFTSNNAVASVVVGDHPNVSLFRLVGTQYSGTDEYIPVNLLSTYRFCTTLRNGNKSGGNVGTGTYYVGLTCYDIDRKLISNCNVRRTNNNKTTLAAPLNPGNTTIQLVSSAGWNNDSNAYYNGIVWYGYANSRGEVYPDYSYTQFCSESTLPGLRGSEGGAWAAGGIAGNTITLRAPWTGPALAAGTAVANSAGGDNSSYFIQNKSIPNVFTTVEGLIQGVDTQGGIPIGSFRPGTAYVKFVLFCNLGGQATAESFFGGVTLTETNSRLVARAYTPIDSTDAAVLPGEMTVGGGYLWIKNASGTIQKVALSAF